MSALVTPATILPNRPSLTGRLSDFLWKHPHVLLAILLGPPVLWLGIIYLGSLFALLMQSFFSIDDFSGLINYEFTFATYRQLLSDANFDIIVRTVTMAAVVTIFSALIAFPIAYYAARYAKGKWKAVFYLGIMLPLWSSYLVKIYAWKLILAKEGILTWAFTKLHLLWLLDGWLSLPIIGGNSLSVHLFADARRLHHSADRRLVATVHRPGRLCAAGHRRQHPARRRFHRRADRHHGPLSLDGQTPGGLRCALTAPPPLRSA
jgi:putative spermidine/putrescine transport system permease protein